MDEEFEVIVDSFPGHAAGELAATFGIELERAQALMQATPVVVRRGASREQALSFVEILSHLGASVRVRRRAQEVAMSLPPPAAVSSTSGAAESMVPDQGPTPHEAPQSPYQRVLDELGACASEAAQARPDYWERGSWALPLYRLQTRPGAAPTAARPVAPARAPMPANRAVRSPPEQPDPADRPRVGELVWGFVAISSMLVHGALSLSTPLGRLSAAAVAGSVLAAPMMMAALFSVFVREPDRRRRRFVAVLAVFSVLGTCQTMGDVGRSAKAPHVGASSERNANGSAP